MNAIVYKNTHTKIPRFTNTAHQRQARGFAYEKDNYFIHIYGTDTGKWSLSTGLTVSQQREGKLRDWAGQVFGANQIKQSKNQVGEVISGVWRPGLYYQVETYQALETNEHEQRHAEQVLRILIEKLDELLLYIEPNPQGLKAFSHKTRELLILACTEVENSWKKYMGIAGITPKGGYFTTKDYCKLRKALFLDQYELKLKPYKNINRIRPFFRWNAALPTQSLHWYDAYNKTKHDRDAHFSEATLLHCINAIAANITLFCVRFSPFPLIEVQSTLSALVMQLFDITLLGCDPSTFYVPKMNFPVNYSKNLVIGQAKDYVEPWVSRPLIL